MDFVAPGEDVMTLSTANRYAQWDGTSFSSPIAASVAALVLTANPQLSPNQVLRIMKKTATRFGRRRRDIEHGYGLPNAAAAVELAQLTRGAYRNRHRRLGIDPFVPRDPYDLHRDSPLGAPLVGPQFIASATSNVARSVPEPATFVLLVVLLAFILYRPVRVPVVAGR